MHSCPTCDISHTLHPARAAAVPPSHRLASGAQVAALLLAVYGVGIGEPAALPWPAVGGVCLFTVWTLVAVDVVKSAIGAAMRGCAKSAGWEKAPREWPRGRRRQRRAGREIGRSEEGAGGERTVEALA